MSAKHIFFGSLAALVGVLATELIVYGIKKASTALKGA